MTEHPDIDSPQNEAEKKKDYRNAVFIQIAFLSLALLADDGLRLVGFGGRGVLFDSIFHVVGGIYLLALCDMLRNYTKAVWPVRISFALLAVAFSIMVGVNLIFEADYQTRTMLRMLAHSILALVQIEVIGFAIRDLFSSRHQASDRLWGSACIYFMSGFVFASLFATILMIEPSAFGERLAPDAYVFFETIYLSFNALVGLDTSYPEAKRLVRNLALVEGMWSQLYLVLLIGRLLTPSSSDTEK
jgi:hypothetical protein